ncbi:MAG: hypothetical protein KKF57_08755 [Firmicutes bacterium]|nr:hypothetical protein [Bacillota bacterium]
MVGSILSNCWAALIAFSLYFALALPNGTPISILTGSFIWALVLFLLTFIIRYLLYYVWQSEEMPVLDLMEQVEIAQQKSNESNPSSEEMAAVVKQLLKDE